MLCTDHEVVETVGRQVYRNLSSLPELAQKYFTDNMNEASKALAIKEVQKLYFCRLSEARGAVDLAYSLHWDARQVTGEGS